MSQVRRAGVASTQDKYVAQCQAAKAKTAPRAATLARLARFIRKDGEEKKFGPPD